MNDEERLSYLSSLSDDQLKDIARQEAFHKDNPTYRKKHKYESPIEREYEKSTVGKLAGLGKEALREAGLAGRAGLAGLTDLDLSGTTGNNLLKGIDYITGNSLKPETRGERERSSGYRAIGFNPTGGIAGKILTGLGGKIPRIAGKAVSGFGKFLRAGTAPTATNIASTGLAGRAMQHEIEEDPESVWNPLVAGIGTGIAVQSVPGLMRSIRNPNASLARGSGKLTGIDPKKLRIWMESGIDPLLPEVSNKLWKATGQATSKFHSNPIEEISKNRMDQILNSMGAFGKPGTRAEAGKKIAESLVDLGIKRSNEQKALIKKFDTLAKQNIKDVDVRDTFEFLKSTMPTPEAGKDALAHWNKTSIGQLYDKFKNYESPISESVPKLIRYENIRLRNLLTKGFPERMSAEEFRKLSKPLESYNVEKTGKLPLDFVENKLEEFLAPKTRKEFGVASDPQKTLLKKASHFLKSDIEKTIQGIPDEEVRSQLQNALKAKKEHWSSYKGNESKSIEEATKKMKESADFVFRDFLGSAQSGKKNMKVVLDSLDYKDKPQFFTDFVHNMSVNPRTNISSGATLSKNYRGMTPEHQKVFKEFFEESTGMPSSRIDKVMDVLKDAAEYAGERNTSGSGIHGEIYRQIMDAHKGSINDHGHSILKKIFGWGVARGINNGLIANKKFLKWVDYGNNIHNPSQGKYLINKMGNLPGMNPDITRKFSKLYNRILDLNAEDKTGKARKSLYGALKINTNHED